MKNIYVVNLKKNEIFLKTYNEKYL